VTCSSVPLFLLSFLLPLPPPPFPLSHTPARNPPPQSPLEKPQIRAHRNSHSQRHNPSRSNPPPLPPRCHHPPLPAAPAPPPPSQMDAQGKKGRETGLSYEGVRARACLRVTLLFTLVSIRTCVSSHHVTQVLETVVDNVHVTISNLRLRCVCFHCTSRTIFTTVFGFII